MEAISPACIKYVERSESATPPPDGEGSSPSSPHSGRLKPRNARKALRCKTRSDTDNSSNRPERKPPDSPAPDNDNNSRQHPHLHRVAAHALSLPDKPRKNLELSLHSRFDNAVQSIDPTRGSIQSPLSDHDVSSLSSYKETSPECEISPPQMDKDSDPIPVGADFRTRNKAPSGRSLESRLRRRPNVARSGPNSPYRNSDRERRESDGSFSRSHEGSFRSDTPSRTSSNVSKNTFYTPESSRKSSLSQLSDASEKVAKQGSTLRRETSNSPKRRPKAIMAESDHNSSAHSSQQSSVVGLDWLFEGDGDSTPSTGK